MSARVSDTPARSGQTGAAAGAAHPHEHGVRPATPRLAALPADNQAQPADPPAAAEPPGRGGRPALARTRAELDALLANRPAARDCSRGTRAVVMTMGALHTGHVQLIRAARARADQVVVTIFVNPLQFGPHEDFARYPRMLDADVDICAAEGVDVVFAPDVVHKRPPLVWVKAGPMGEVLEGAARPGHFDGMLTTVATLLHLTQPDLAFFGRKDAQQLICIQRMIADLGFGVQVVGVPTVRDPDGLALSSRNAYLTTTQRRTALALSRALAAGVAVCDEGADAVLAAAGEVLAAADGLEVDYLTLASPEDLRPIQHGNALLLVAARIGATRLIDNIELTLPDPPMPADPSGLDGVAERAHTPELAELVELVEPVHPCSPGL